MVTAVTIVALGYWSLRPAEHAPTDPHRPVDAQPLAGWRPPTADELAARPSPLDGRTREQIPPVLLGQAGDGDPNRAPSELVAILGAAGRPLDPGVPVAPDVSKGPAVAGIPVPCGRSPSAETAGPSRRPERGVVYLWDLAGWPADAPQPPVRALNGHTATVYSVAFSPGNRFLASAGYHDRTVHVTDLKTMRLVHTASGGGAGGAEARVAFAADGRTLVYGGWDDTIRAWDVVDQKETVLAGAPKTADGLAADPLGRVVAAAGHAGLMFLDRSSPSRAFAIPREAFGGLPRHVAFTPEGRYLVAAGFNGTVSILRVPPPPPYDPGPPRKLPEPGELAKRLSPLDGLDQGAILPSGAAAVLGDNRFRLPQGGHNSETRQDREGEWLAVPNGETVALFDARSGALIRTLCGRRSGVQRRVQPRRQVTGRGKLDWRVEREGQNEHCSHLERRNRRGGPHSRRLRRPCPVRGI